MKQNIGIWIDTKQAVAIKLFNNKHSVKIIESNIETRERVAGESKKYGRFGGQYMTFEKNKLNRKNEQTNQFIKNLIKEVENCESVVLFGPSKMKNIFEKELLKNLQLSTKLVGVYNSKQLTENQMVAWVKDFFEK
jgi:fructose-1-phosphate kinase PfkB-like protein